VEPWFLGRKLQLSVDLYHRELQFLSDLYDQTETGGRVGLTKAIFRDWIRAGVSYTLENIGLDFEDRATEPRVSVTRGGGRSRQIDVIKPQVSPELAAEDGDWLVSKVGGILTFDRRGPGLLPSRGHVTDLRGTLGGGPFGGDTDFYKLEMETAWYFPGFASGHVLELIGRIGVVEEYGDSERTHIWDRYFLGGAYTLRGYDYRDVGPKDSLGEPIGGNTYWMASAEYSIPIISRLRFAVFYDAGLVNARAYDFATDGFADDVGLGIRINIPQMGPLRLDYGFPITHDETTGDSPRFNFSVGYSRRL
jgi:outer membrane protein insertion porin family